MKKPIQFVKQRMKMYPMQLVCMRNIYLREENMRRLLGTLARLNELLSRYF